MPYRADLKRPDLKGSFPCSICQKVFCHSSSLSRHRMQAHFKSYTCTQCNDEIPSNDTLRSHMYRMHNITRMFMCRCCNWAFPDKTSLHIHMQSMLKSGTPGEAAVLAKSSDVVDGNVESTSSPRGSPSFPADVFQKRMIQVATNNNNLGSIFPNLLKTPITPGSKPIFPLDLSNMGPNQFLSAWLANNPINTNSINLSSLQKTPSSKQSVTPDYDDMEVHTTEEDLKYEAGSTDASPRSVIVKTETPDAKREMSFEADIDVEGDETDLKMTIDDKDMHISQDQPSPTVSDSHISGSSSHSGESAKCFDCQVAKGRLSAAEEKVQIYEKQVRELQQQIEYLRKLVMPQGPPVMLPSPLLPMPHAPPANLLQNPAMRMLINNFVQNQMNQRNML